MVDLVEELGADAYVHGHAVDLERKLIVTPDGREVPFDLDESTRFRLLNGLDDIGLTLQHEQDITAYETAHGIA